MFWLVMALLFGAGLVAWHVLSLYDELAALRRRVGNLENRQDTAAKQRRDFEAAIKEYLR